MIHDMPRPTVAMPATSTLVRALREECANTLDAAPGIASTTLEPIALTDGTLATIRCSRSRRTGALHVSVSFRSIRTEAAR
ncbi:MAG: hypothetical protein NVS3B16_24800 [Vulcanimicrobiaceae bacterium]